MARVLISSIGTGDIRKDSDSDYEETIYRIDGREYKNTLTSQPIIEHFEIKRVFFIGTVGSMWDNLYFKYGGSDENYLDFLTKRKKDKTLIQKDLIVLEQTLDKYLNSEGSKCILIDYEKNNEEEVWRNFEKILDIKKFIDEEDEIYLDITHGFRYMPVLNIFALEFLTQLNEKFRPKAILYGMFADQKSEILNFSIFLELLEWAKAIDELERFASLERVVILSNGKIEQNGYNVLVDMQRAFDIAYMSAIYKSIKNLNNHLNYFTENENKIIRLIAPKVKEFVKKLSKNTLSEFQFSLAEFFANKHYHSLAYIALAEAVITYICEKEGLNKHNKEEREKVKDIIHSYKNYSYGSKQRKFFELYFTQINKIRKNIAHQLETNKNPKEDIANFNKYLRDSKKILKEIFG